MKNLKTIIFLVLAVSFLACNNSNNNENEEINKEGITQAEAQAILAKYDLFEGSAQIVSKAEVMGKHKSLVNKTEPLKKMNKEEFERLVAGLEGYQKSEQGRRMHEMAVFKKKMKAGEFTEQQIDAFYKGYDEEYGTKYFENSKRNFKKERIPNSSRRSEYNGKITIEKVDALGNYTKEVISSSSK